MYYQIKNKKALSRLKMNNLACIIGKLNLLFRNYTKIGRYRISSVSDAVLKWVFII